LCIDSLYDRLNSSVGDEVLSASICLLKSAIIPEIVPLVARGMAAPAAAISDNGICDRRKGIIEVNSH
jgi:hypothetical protein